MNYEPRFLIDNQEIHHKTYCRITHRMWFYGSDGKVVAIFKNIPINYPWPLCEKHFGDKYKDIRSTQSWKLNYGEEVRMNG